MLPIITVMAHRTRVALAVTWGLFLLIWFPTTVLVLVLAHVPCDGDGGRPYARVGSARNVYCRAISDYWSWGEPGSLHAIPFVLPILAPIAIGIAGVLLQRTQLLKRGAIGLSIGSLLYLVIPWVLQGPGS